MPLSICSYIYYVIHQKKSYIYYVKFISCFVTKDSYIITNFIVFVAPICGFIILILYIITVIYPILPNLIIMFALKVFWTIKCVNRFTDSNPFWKKLSTLVYLGQAITRSIVEMVGKENDL